MLMRCQAQFGQPRSVLHYFLHTAALLLAVAGVVAGAGERGLFDFGKKEPPAAVEDAWAVRCLSVRGSERFKIVDKYAAALKTVKGLDAKLVLPIHGDEDSVLYYGRYQRTLNSATQQPEYRPNPAKGLDLIQSLNVSNSNLVPNDPNNWPFRMATIAQLPAGASTHPEWNLDNATGYWSLHVAVFYNTDQMTQRKSAAVEYCELLREQSVEAYFHHGSDKSSVTVGIFQADAVVDVQDEDALTGNLRVACKIAEPRIAELQKKFPHSHENGHLISQRTQDPTAAGGYKKTPTPSFIIRLPKVARERADDRERAARGS